MGHMAAPISGGLPARTRDQAHALPVDQPGGPLPTLIPMRPARDGGQRRGFQGADRDADRVCQGRRRNPAYRVRAARLTHHRPDQGPDRGPRHYASRGPSVRQTRKVRGAGGGPGAFKWYPGPELGRSQGVPAPGRWTRDGWGPPALGGPTKCHGSSQARPGARVWAGQGAVRLQVPWVRARERAGA